MYFRRALVDAKRANLAIKALDDLAAHDAAPAKHLHGAIDHALAGFCRGHFRHSGLTRRRQLLDVPTPGGAIGQQRRGVDFGRHVSKRGLGQLQVGQRAAKHAAVSGMINRLVKRASREAQRCGRNGGAKNIERLHRNLEAAAWRPEPSSSGNPAILEAQRRQRMRGDHVDPLGD